MFSNYFLIHLLVHSSLSVAYPSAFWKNIVQQLNNFRRLRVVDLKVSNMQKIYWDENLEILAYQKIFNYQSLRIKNDHSTTFWIETSEKEEVKRVDEFFVNLTQKSSHREDRVTESVWNNPFNLIINGDTIRIGCSQAEVYLDSKPVIVMLCVFGPSPILLNDRLYARGPACSACPVETGCEDNLCDEKTKQGLPPIIDILGVRMSTKSQIIVGIVAVVAICIVIGALVIQYFY